MASKKWLHTTSSEYLLRNISISINRDDASLAMFESNLWPMISFLSFMYETWINDRDNYHMTDLEHLSTYAYLYSTGSL